MCDCALCQVEKTSRKDTAAELATDSDKTLVACSSLPTTVSDCIEPMDTDNEALKDKDPEASTAKITDTKTSYPKSPSHSSPPSSQPASSSCVDLKQIKEYKEEDIKEKESKKEDLKKGSLNESKMKLDLLKIETKTEKMEVSQTAKPSRPSSTPPSDTGMRE